MEYSASAPRAWGCLALTLALALVACGGENTPGEAASETVEAPPLEEPSDMASSTDEQTHTVSESPAPAAENAEGTDNGTDSDSDDPEGEPGQEDSAEEGNGDSGDGESGALDASEFSTDSQTSTGFPDPLTEVPEDGRLLLSEVRVGVHDGYDRIVFDHHGEGAPGWTAEYVDDAVEPGSGFPIDVEAEAILYIGVVGLQPGNAGQDHGHLEIGPGWTDQWGTIFDDVVSTFVHHGSASYYVGLDTERDFRVSVWEHEDGPRLIIDVLH